MLMNIRVTICLLACFLFFQTTPGITQVTEVFSGDPVQYLDELYLYMQKNINAESERILNDFMSLWSGGAFNLQQQQRIANTSRNLIEKNAKPHPHFSNFLSCMISFKHSLQTNYTAGLQLM